MKTTNTEELLERVISDVDALIQSQLDKVTGHPDFQHLHAAWKSLEWLAWQVGSSAKVSILVFDASLGELRKDFEYSIETRNTTLFRQVYEERLGTLGGQPLSVLIADYSFSRSARDMDMLRYMAELGSLCKVPVITGASPALLGCRNFSSLNSRQLGLDRIFDGRAEPAYWHWSALRDSERAAYLALALPRFKLDHVAKSEGAANAGLSSSPLWGNAAFVIAAGLVRQALPASESTVDATDGRDAADSSNDRDSSVQTEETLSRSVRQALMALGFIALSPDGQCTAELGRWPSCQRTGSGEKRLDAGRAGSEGLRTVFLTCRMLHHIIDTCWHHRGTFDYQPSWDELLHRRLMEFATEDDSPTEQARRLTPLRSASIGTERSETEFATTAVVIDLRFHSAWPGQPPISARVKLKLPV